MVRIPTFASLSPARKRSLALGSMLLATVAAIAGWAWWVSFDNPEIIPRAHDVMWDVVSYAMERQGRPAATPVGEFSTNPIVQLAVDSLLKFGNRYAAIVTAQIPFLILLILSTGFLAWRLGGYLAAGLAPWLAAFAPMTVGLAVQLDDLLAYQALLTTALALVAWSDGRRKWWLAFLAPIPIALAIRLSIWFSTQPIFLAIFAVGACSLLLFQWGTWWIRFKAGDVYGWRETPWASTLGILAAFAAGIYFSLPIRFEYFIEQATHPDYRHMNAFENSAYLFAYPRVWFHLHAGPCLASLALVAVPLVMWGKRWIAVLPYLGWLFLPMLLFVFINKRLDFYLVANVPATYGLAALGVASIPLPRIRTLAAALAVLVAASGWVDAVTTDIQDFATKELSRVFEGYPNPYLFSPYLRKQNDYRKLGDLIAKECAPQQLPVLFVSEADIDQREAFHTWRAHPDFSIYDLKREPYPKPVRACLVFFFDDSPSDAAYTLDRAIREMRQRMEAKYLLDDQLKRGLMLVEANQENYRLAGSVEQWGVFVPRKGAVMNPPDPLNKFPREHE